MTKSKWLRSGLICLVLALSLNVIAVGQSWTGPSGKLPFQSKFGPAMTVFNNKIYVAYRDASNSDKLTLFSSTDGVNWGGKTLFAGGKQAFGYSSPALASDGASLYLAFLNTGQVYEVWRSTDGVTFAQYFSAVPAGVILSNSENPSIIWWQGQLYLGAAAMTSDSNGIQTNDVYLTTGSSGWTKAIQYSPQYHPYSAPTLYIDAWGTMRFAYLISDGHVVTSDYGYQTNMGTFDGLESTKMPGTNDIYMVGKAKASSSQHIWVSKNFQPNTQAGGLTTTTPGMVGFNNSLIMTFKSCCANDIWFQTGY